ncbi:MAG: hypothetical protein ABIV47_06845, partial [Roseiflexaceae bacterium]
MQLSISTARYRRLILLCSALLLVGACQNAPSAPPSAVTGTPSASLATAAPTEAAPTSVSQPTTSSPTSAVAPQPTAAMPQPTAIAPAAALLPAPIYLLDGGQIWRMERDGQTRRQLTFEPTDIFDFAIGATDNALAYVVGVEEASTIVLLDESGRTELIRGSMWGPQISPSGEQIAFQIEATSDAIQNGQAQEFDNGVWLIDRAGGRPSLLQASEPISKAGSLIESARQYSPRAWSPDGTQLLMGVYFP